METTTAGKFGCDACGKRYTWKPELAGKRVKCKCGGILSVPRTDPAAPPAADDALPPDFDDLYALAEGAPVAQAVTPPTYTRGGTPCPSCGVNVPGDAVLCVSCGTNVKTGKKVKTKKVSGGGGGPTPALATAGTGPRGVLGYAQMAPKRRGEERQGGDVFFHPVKDLYIPGALVVAGTVLSYLALVFHHGVRNPGAALFAVGLMTLINLVLTVPAVLLTVKLFDLGLGPIGPGVLKIAACAIAPGAIGELMGMILTGSAGMMGGWFISYAITLLIFMKLLEMDFGEVLICSSFIFVIRTWAVYGILFALLHGLGISLPAGAGGGMGMGGGGGRLDLAGVVDDGDDALDAMHARESDDEAIRHLHGGGVDARTWFDANDRRTLAGQSRGDSMQVINGLYAAGAGEIRAFTTTDARDNEIAYAFIVVPPADKSARPRILGELKRLAKTLGRTTPRDRGEKYFPVELLTPDEKEKLFDAQMESHFKSLPKGAAQDKDDDGDDGDDADQ
jgi:hypothetical protein